MIFNTLKIPSRKTIIEEAYTWEHVPYVDGQHSKYGCDCVGLLVGISKALNFIEQDWKPDYYSPQWHLHSNDEKLLHTLEDTGCIRKNLDERIPGDILTFQFYNVSAHVGLFMPKNTVIHSLIDRGVILHGLRGIWQTHYLKYCWKFPGVTDDYAC